MQFETTNAVVLTGVIVTAGRWAEGQKITMRVVVGAVFLTIGLAGLAELNADLASAFAMLILVAAMLRYVVPIADKAGIRS